MTNTNCLQKDITFIYVYFIFILSWAAAAAAATGVGDILHFWLLFHLEMLLLATNSLYDLSYAMAFSHNEVS